MKYLTQFALVTGLLLTSTVLAAAQSAGGQGGGRGDGGGSSNENAWINPTHLNPNSTRYPTREYRKRVRYDCAENELTGPSQPDDYCVKRKRFGR